MPREYLTPPQIAKLLGCNVQKVRNWIGDGQLRASDLGDANRPRWRIHRDDLNEFLDRRANRREPKKTRRRVKLSGVKEFV